MTDLIDLYPRHVFPEPNTGCFLCTLNNNQDGYARLKLGGHTIGAHRIAYELRFGSVAPGLEIDHLCRQPCCVNPDHMELVSPSDNKRRRWRDFRKANGGKCPHGHDLSGDNLYLRQTGQHSCRECARASRLKYNTRRT